VWGNHKMIAYMAVTWSCPKVDTTLAVSFWGSV